MRSYGTYCRPCAVEITECAMNASSGLACSTADRECTMFAAVFAARTFGAVGADGALGAAVAEVVVIAMPARAKAAMPVSEITAPARRRGCGTMEEVLSGSAKHGPKAELLRS